MGMDSLTCSQVHVSTEMNLCTRTAWLAYSKWSLPCGQADVARRASGQKLGQRDRPGIGRDELKTWFPHYRLCCKPAHGLQQGH